MQSRAPERRVEVVHLGRGLNLDIERRCEKWRPGDELLVDRPQAVDEHGAVVLGASVQLDVEERAKERSKRVVGRRGLVLLAAQRDLPHVRAVLAQLLRKARLPDPRLPDQLDHRSEAHPDRRDRRRQNCSLPLAVDERKLPFRRVALGACGVIQEVAEHECLHGLALPLDGERLELRRVEESSSSCERARRDPDLVLCRAGHEACGECSRIAEHGVRAAEARANLACEDTSRAHADPHGKRRAGVDDRAHGSEHPLLVVAESLRRSRDQHDSSAVTVDVALEERDAVVFGCCLYRTHESIERIGRGFWRPRWR